MKLLTLLESLRAEIIKLQQKLIEALDDEFDVVLASGVYDGRASYSLKVKHPLLKAPVTIKVIADGPRGPEVKIGSYTQFDLSHPTGFETMLDSIHEKVDAVKIRNWLLEHKFKLINKEAFEAERGVKLYGAGKSHELYALAIDGGTVIFKLGFDSYQNVQHEWWLVKNDLSGKSVGHRIRSFGEVEVLIGAMIRARA